MSMHCEHASIPAARRDIHFVQASRRAAINRPIAATKIVEMEGYKLRARNGEIKCETLGRSHGTTAGSIPFSHVRPDFGGQHFEVRRIPGVLRDSPMGKRWLQKPKQSNKTACKHPRDFGRSHCLFSQFVKA